MLSAQWEPMQNRYSTRDGQLEKGFSLSAFAPCKYLGDAWRIEGDYRIPVLKEKKIYEEARKNPDLGRKRGIVHN